MPVILKTVALATVCGVTCMAPLPVTEPTAIRVISAPVIAAPKKIIVAKLSYEEELMKKYHELKELENHWNR